MRPWLGAIRTISNSVRVSYTLVREAASTSIKSTKRFSAISTQAVHWPHGSELTPDSQFRHLARMRAMVVLPTPRVPVNRRSEEHTSELQSRGHLVRRLLLEKKQVVAAPGGGRACT